MINKVYDNIRNFLKTNLKELIVFFVLLFILTYQFPYYIDATGVMINVDKRVTIKAGYEGKGSFNAAFVRSMKATIPTLVIAKLNRNWDILKEEEVLFEDETYDEMLARGAIQLKSTGNNAIINAYALAKKETTISNIQTTVMYRFDEADTDLLIGDIVTKINGVSVSTFEEITTEIKKSKVGDNLSIEVKNKDKTYSRYAKLQEIEGQLVIGIIMQQIFDVDANPECTLSFTSKESGPSGGLMTSLAIYNRITKEDFTKGLKIAGTGTIEYDGSIGEIGGVKYKLAGVVKEKADIFFVPAGDNYEEAMKYKKKNKYKIEIVPIENFEDAVKYLKDKKD